MPTRFNTDKSGLCCLASREKKKLKQQAETKAHIAYGENTFKNQIGLFTCQSFVSNLQCQTTNLAPMKFTPSCVQPNQARRYAWTTLEFKNMTERNSHSQIRVHWSFILQSSLPQNELNSSMKPGNSYTKGYRPDSTCFSSTSWSCIYGGT